MNRILYGLRARSSWGFHWFWHYSSSSAGNKFHPSFERGDKLVHIALSQCLRLWSRQSLLLCSGRVRFLLLSPRIRTSEGLSRLSWCTHWCWRMWPRAVDPKPPSWYDDGPKFCTHQRMKWSHSSRWSDKTNGLSSSWRYLWYWHTRRIGSLLFLALQCLSHLFCWLRDVLCRTASLLRSTYADVG